MSDKLTKDHRDRPAPVFRPALEGLSTNPGAEILRYGWRRSDILSLGQGEGDRPTPDFIARAAHTAMQEGKTFYGPVLGHMDLRDEIAAYYQRHIGCTLPANRVFVTGSGTTAMHMALTAILDKGDDVVAVTPIWKNLLGAVEVAQAHTTQVGLVYTPQQGWHLDMQALKDACKPETKAILIVSPSNPTGWTITREEIAEILGYTRERGIWIISDEVYSRTHFTQKITPSFLEMAEPEDRLFVVNSFSKNWAMTGWRLGWLVGPARAEGVIRDLALYDNMGPPSFTQYGAIAALRDGEDFIEDQLAMWRSNRDYLCKRLAATGKVDIPVPEATFYAFFRVEGENDCMAFARRLIDDAALSLAPGCAFGHASRSYMRLCFAVSRPRLEQALDRLEKAIGS